MAKDTKEWQNDRRMSKHVPRLKRRSNNRNTKTLRCDMSVGKNVLYLLLRFQLSSDTLHSKNTRSHMNASHCSLSWLHHT